MRRTALFVLPALGLATACGSATKGGGSSIAIQAGDTTCDVAVTTLAAGEHVFSVKNTGRDVTEVYLYAKGGDGGFSKVVNEVENVGPGITRSLKAQLGGGDYQFLCKPGMKGEGIKAALTVTGERATAAAYDREVQVTAKDDAFTGLGGFTAKAGEKIEFKLVNMGSMQHELEVFGPDGKPVGEVGPTNAGQRGEVVLELRSPGTYTYESGIADDAARGLKGSFTVS